MAAAAVRRAVLAAVLFCRLAEAGTNHGNKEGYNCNEYFTSADSLNGTFQSPTYPYPYPARVKCKYFFIGNATQRVRIVFTDFDLYTGGGIDAGDPPDSSTGTDSINGSYEEAERDPCLHKDSVRVFVTIDGRLEMVTDFCGNELPVPIMSSGPEMTIEFESRHSSPELRGFQALYAFVTDFGITEGHQTAPGECAFAYNSTESANGSFTSPNYPGLYPRDTACNYLFYGKRGQVVEIEFESFDLDGAQPCTSMTASDYVEFSDFRNPDRGIWKHCGHALPVKRHSENHFFRVSFRSDQRFDDRGFLAKYVFKPKEDPYGNNNAVVAAAAPTRSSRMASGAAAGSSAALLTAATTCTQSGYVMLVIVIACFAPPIFSCLATRF